MFVDMNTGHLVEVILDDDNKQVINQLFVTYTGNTFNSRVTLDLIQ